MNYLITYLQSIDEPTTPDMQSIGHMEIDSLQALPLVCTHLQSTESILRFSVQQEENNIDIAEIHTDICAKYSKLVPRTQLMLENTLKV
jgi:hypothetical protein